MCLALSLCIFSTNKKETDKIDTAMSISIRVKPGRKVPQESFSDASHCFLKRIISKNLRNQRHFYFALTSVPWHLQESQIAGAFQKKQGESKCLHHFPR